MGQCARGRDLGLEIGEPMPPHLELRDRPSEHLAVLRVRDRRLERLLRGGDAGERHHQPLPLEVLHDADEAFILVAQEILGRDATLVEEELGGVRGPPSDRSHAVGREAGCVLLDDDERYPSVALAAGAGGDDDVVRFRTVGDERLLAGQDEVVTVAGRFGLDVRDVGARARLCYAERADHLPSDRRNQPALPLLFRSEPVDVVRAEILMPADTRSDAAGSALGELFVHDRIGEEIRTCASVPLFVLQPEKSELPEAQVEVAWEVVRALPLLDVGSELFLDELSNRVAERDVVLGEELPARAHYSPISFEMTSRMTSSVPPPMRISRESRQTRWIGRSIVYAAPPKICIASLATRLATMPPYSFAIEISLTGYSPVPNFHAAS